MIYRSGPWNGIRYSGTPKPTHRLLFNVDFVTNNKDEYYFVYKPRDPSLISRIVINETVNAVERFTWSSSTEEGNKSIQRWNWKLVLNLPRDGCDYYGHCGPFGNCAIMGKSPVCQCLSGFTPKSPQNWSQGCVRSESWRCREKNKDGFIRFKNIKVPDTRKSWIDRSVTLEECKAKCWENCSCTAYANSNITEDGSGCILCFGDLLDLRQLPDSGQDLYVRSSLASQTGICVGFFIFLL